MPSEKQIKDDVRKWSRLNLEVPNQHLNGMPACPFAKKTWNDDKVVVEVKTKFKQYKSELNTHLKQLDFSVHEILIFCDPYFSYTIDDFQGIIDSYNFWYNRKDIYFMGFHPRGTPTLEEHAFLVDPGPDESYDGELEYSMMLIQKFSQLQEASGKLHRQGYYKKWPNGYYQDVVVSRQKTYKRIFGG